MSQPDTGDVHTNTPLTNISIAHMNKMTDFGADTVFPVIFVPKQSDIIPIYTRGFFFVDEAEQSLRAQRTQAATVGWEIDTTSTYRTISYALGVELSDEIMDNADTVWQMERSATELLTQLSAIRRERAFSSVYMVISKWGTDVVGGTNFTQWSDYGSSDPFNDIEDGIASVGDTIGQDANKMVMGNIVWRRLKHHPDFIDRIKGGATAASPAVVTQQLLSSLLGLEKLVVAKARYRTSAEGASSLTLAPIVDDDALLLYTPESAQLLTPTAGATFVWESRAAGRRSPVFMRRGVNTRRKYRWIEAHQNFDQKATETEGGYFFEDAVD